jgi:hypothetical protein
MWLIASIRRAEGDEVVDQLALGHQRVGEPRFAHAREWLRGHGYDIHLGSVQDPAEWPLVVVAYKSPNREGVGRCGGQFMTWRARERDRVDLSVLRRADFPGKETT